MPGMQFLRVNKGGIIGNGRILKMISRAVNSTCTMSIAEPIAKLVSDKQIVGLAVSSKRNARHRNSLAKPRLNACRDPTI